MTSSTLKPLPGLQRADAVLAGTSSDRYFRSFVVEPSSPMMAEIYRLRYRVMCIETDILPVTACPDGREFDEYDRRAVHVATVNSKGKLVASARVIQGPLATLPVSFWCSIYPAFAAKLSDSAHRIAEVSHVMLDRSVRARAGDGLSGDCIVAGQPGAAGVSRGISHVALSLYGAIYRVLKRAEAKWMVCSMDKGCHLAFYRHRLPFRAIGPLAEYIGTVTPFALSIEELDQVLKIRHPALWSRFASDQVAIEPGIPTLSEILE